MNRKSLEVIEKAALFVTLDDTVKDHYVSQSVAMTAHMYTHVLCVM